MYTRVTMVLFGVSASPLMESFTSLEVRMGPLSYGKTVKDLSACGKQTASSNCHPGWDTILGGVYGVLFGQRMHRNVGSPPVGTLY
jgi:hypothetical protein